MKKTKTTSQDIDETLKTCPYCNFGNNLQAQYCKKCGKKLNQNFISRFNNDLNLFAVFIGLGVSCIVLIISSLIVGYIIVAATLDVSIFVAVVLMFMMFCGGITTGIVGCDDVKEGARNGIFMSLIAMVILGFVVGGLLFITMDSSEIPNPPTYYSSLASTSELPSHFSTLQIIGTSFTIIKAFSSWC